MPIMYVCSTNTQLNSQSMSPSFSLGRTAPTDWRERCACSSRTSCGAPPYRRETERVWEFRIGSINRLNFHVSHVLVMLLYDIVQLLVHSNYDSIYLVLFHTSISYESHVLMNIKTEQGAWLSPSLVDDKVIERVMLYAARERSRERGIT
jgi:hypothetical protein